MAPLEGAVTTEDLRAYVLDLIEKADIEEVITRVGIRDLPPINGWEMHEHDGTYTVTLTLRKKEAAVVQEV